jgi:hypothetical protein
LTSSAWSLDDGECIDFDRVELLAALGVEAE